MSKLRSVNTHFWNDNYVIDLDPTEKLLFLYLLTNDATNMLGIYELNIRKIAFDTGIDKDMAMKIFGRFSADGKASYVDGYVILHNFLKHQKLNTNMQTSAVRSFNELPESVKRQEFVDSIYKALKGFDKASEPIAEIEVESERELETETEVENESSPEISDLFCDGFHEHTTIHKILNSTTVPEDLDDDEFRHAFMQYWVYYYQSFKKVPTPIQAEMQMLELYRLKERGSPPVEVIRQTITAGNKSFYELKNFNNGKKGEKNGSVDADQIIRDTEAMFANG